MTGSLLILGCGGHGRVVADAALDCGYDDLAFLDDGGGPPGWSSPYPILGPMGLLTTLAGRWPQAIAALGDGARRLALFDDLRRAGFATPSLLHPSAVVSRGAQVGAGVFVAAGAVINTGARIADAVIVNTGARIDHDCAIGRATHIAPGATLSGNVQVGSHSWVGTGVSVRQGVRIGDHVTVGVGAAVVADLLAPGTYVGVPARALAGRTEA